MFVSKYSIGNQKNYSRNKFGSDGFSVVELLVVLVIMASASAIVLSYTPQRSHKVDLQEVTSAVVSRARRARLRAIVRREESFLFINLHSKEVGIGDLPSSRITLPPNLVLDVVTARSHIAQGIARIGFFPDGASTGAIIKIRLGINERQIVIDWMIGLPRETKAILR